MTTHITRILTLLMASALVMASCEPPGAIAPLPSPLEPDDDKIITSSLMRASDSEAAEEKLVAVVGFDGAVEGEGMVRLVNLRNRVVDEYDSTISGSFSAAVLALPDDSYDVVYITADGRESKPVRLTVAAIEQADRDSDTLVEVDDPQVPAGGGGDDNPDEQPNTGEAGGRDSSENQGTPPPLPAFTNMDSDDDEHEPVTEPPADPDDAPPPEEGDGTKTDQETTAGAGVAIATSVQNGVFHFQASAGFTWANAIVIFTNHTRGTAHSTIANESGAINISFGADEGDIIIVFTQHPENEDITGEALTFYAK